MGRSLKASSSRRHNQDGLLVAKPWECLRLHHFWVQVSAKVGGARKIETAIGKMYATTHEFEVESALI